MKNQIRNNIRKGKKLKETIPQYLQEMKLLYQRYGMLQLVFAYYDFCEDRREKELLYTEDIKEMTGKLETILEEMAISFEPDKLKKLQESFFQLRQESVDKMEQWMEYVSRIELFEHILNHMQYKFDPPYDGEYDREVIAQRLYDFIFSDNDNIVTDGKIKCLIEQFPAPIVKAKFYDYIMQNIGLYTGGDRESLDRMLSALRSTGCLNKLEDRGEHQLFDSIKQLEELDYRSMDEREFEETKQFVSHLSLQVEKKIDSLCLYQKVLNCIGALLLCDTKMADYEEEYSILKLLLESRGEYEKLRQAEARFCEVEGRQEELSYEIDQAGVYLEDLPQIEKKGQKTLKDIELEKERMDLVFAGILLSDHLFAPLSQAKSETVTEEMARREAERFIEEMKQFFKEHSRVVNQSVMARVLASLPTVYKSAKEVAQHIEYAIIQSSSKEQVMANFELYQMIQGKF